MVNNFSVSHKTQAPFCGYSCCGSKWGRIERSEYANIHHNNRIRKLRRYAKRAERDSIKREIREEIREVEN